MITTTPTPPHAHRAPPHPHDGACPGCRDARVCNVCGGALDFGRCTNGRCSDCHRTVCTPGGATDAGHGFGTPT